MNVSKLPKWAQARIIELEARVIELERVRKPEKVERDLPPPGSWAKELSRGWDFNDYKLLHSKWECETVVYKACSSSVHHGTGWEKTTSQQPVHLFSSEVRAWKALRAKVLKFYSEKLAFIDRKIRELEGNDP